MYKPRGFTLVEFIVVLVLVGIVSALAISRVGSNSAYDSRALKDTFISQARFAQQVGMSRSGVAVSLHVNLAANQWHFFVKADSEELNNSTTLSANTITLLAKAGNNCTGASILNAAGLIMQFDLLGKLSALHINGVDQSVSNGVVFCISDGTTTDSVLVSSEGFAQ
jgi:prepilin-type N-terminal cleavage/methylation domain-containing protein